LLKCPKKKSKFFSHCGNAFLNVSYSSSTLPFFGAFVIFSPNRSRYFRIYAISSFASNSHPSSICPAMILVGFRASIRSSVRYYAWRILGVSISSTQACVLRAYTVSPVTIVLSVGSQKSV
jgi:hypothetical protein